MFLGLLNYLVIFPDFLITGKPYQNIPGFPGMNGNQEPRHSVTLVCFTVFFLSVFRIRSSFRSALQCIHYIDPFTHRQRSQPCEAPSCLSGSVSCSRTLPHDARRRPWSRGQSDSLTTTSLSSLISVWIFFYLCCNLRFSV